jgi:hypothetical protein
MLYEKQKDIQESDNNAPPKEETDGFTANAEAPQENRADGIDENIVVSKLVDDPDGMSNEVIDYDSNNRRESSENDIPPVTSYPIYEDFTVGMDIEYTEDYYNADEVVLDPDNFEYFKGVSSNNSQINFVNR